MRIASRMRSVPIASALAAYSAASKLICTRLWAATLEISVGWVSWMMRIRLCVGEVAVMELEADVGLMQVAIDIIDPPSVERGNAGDQCDFVGHKRFAIGSNRSGGLRKRHRPFNPRSRYAEIAA
jgi:hypothetical protein